MTNEQRKQAIVECDQAIAIDKAILRYWQMVNDEHETREKAAQGAIYDAEERLRKIREQYPKAAMRILNAKNRIDIQEIRRSDLRENPEILQKQLVKLQEQIYKIQLQIDSAVFIAES